MLGSSGSENDCEFQVQTAAGGERRAQAPAAAGAGVVPSQKFVCGKWFPNRSFLYLREFLLSERILVRVFEVFSTD